MRLIPFAMERYQSTYEHRVGINLSESGVDPLSAEALIAMAAETGRARQHLTDCILRTQLGYGQSNGSDELRALIAGLYAGAGDDSILVTVGGAEANFACFWHLAESRGHAAALVPTYGQVPGLVSSFSGRITPVPLVEAEGWQPDLAALDRALSAGARFLLVTNPNNPTGAVLSREAMREIVRLTEHHGAWILADEVYSGAETGANADPGGKAPAEEPETPSFWGSHDRVLATGSLSKAYGLPGLRVGWAVGPKETIAELWGRTDYTTIAPAKLSDALAAMALHPEVRPRVIGRTRKIVRSNLGVLEEWVASQGNRFSYRPPDAGAICYLRYDVPVNSTEFAEKLRLEKDLLVVPGDHFGMDGYVRIGFGNPADELRVGLERVREAFDEVAFAPAAL